MALSDEEIAESVETVLREANPNTPCTSLNDVVRQVESKLGLDLSHKIDFIRNHIQFLFLPHQQPHPPYTPQQQPILHHQKDHFALHLQKDHFALHQHKDRFAPHHHNHQLQQQQQTHHGGFQSAAAPTEVPFRAKDPKIEGYNDNIEQPAAAPTEVPFRAKDPKVEGYNDNIEQPAAAPTEVPFRAKDPKVEDVPFRAKDPKVEEYNGNNEQPPATTAETSKESAQKGKKRRGGPGGLNKLCGVSPLLRAIVGHPVLPRTEIVKQLWIYIRKNNLQDPSNKRKIICNDELRLVFETDCTDMFKMNKLLVKHIIPLEPSKQTSQSSKKLKTEIESESKSLDTVPIVIISEALASFFGTNEREISQVEVLRQIWEYIKVNQLEDPLNAVVIHCDAKLQELLGCESISALGIPEMLSRRHLFKKS